jgi:MFS family permease
MCCPAPRPLCFDLGPLTVPGFWPIVAAILGAAVGLSMAFTSIAARAQKQGVPAAAGYIEAALALGSLTGGLLWGRRRHTRTHSTHLAGLIGVLAIGIAISAAVTSLTTLGTLMAVIGLAIAPLFVVSYLAADELAPEPSRPRQAPGSTPQTTSAAPPAPQWQAYSSITPIFPPDSPSAR